MALWNDQLQMGVSLNSPQKSISYFYLNVKYSSNIYAGKDMLISWEKFKSSQN